MGKEFSCNPPSTGDCQVLERAGPPLAAVLIRLVISPFRGKHFLVAALRELI